MPIIPRPKKLYFLTAFFCVFALISFSGEAEGKARGKNKRVQTETSKKDQMWLLSYDVLIAMPESDRIAYLQGVREALIEFDQLNESSSIRMSSIEKPRIYAQLETLYRLLVQDEAQAELPSLGIFKYDRNPKPKEQIRVWCYDQDGNSTGKAVAMEDGWYCNTPGSTAFSCPDGSFPEKSVTPGGGWEPICRGSHNQYVPAVQKSTTTPNFANTNQTTPDVGEQASSGSQPQSAIKEDEGESSAEYDTSLTQKTLETFYPGGTIKQSQVKSDPQGGSESPENSNQKRLQLPFKPELYGVDKSKAAKDAWGLIEQMRKTCPIKVLDKASCEAKPKSRAKSCFIAGVKSSYGRRYCKPVRKLCFGQNGETLVNEACKGKNAFECGPNETVCNPVLGFRDEGDRLGPNDRSRGAFCAPIKGHGAKSATAICAEWNQKYEATKLGKNTFRDILAVGNTVQTQRLWEGLRRDMQELCDDSSVTYGNCEACQVLKLRLAILAKQASGSQQCREPGEIQPMKLQPQSEPFAPGSNNDIAI